jgi:8-oxo-dGTP pyrophosphatase MutT (NUDIX family)
MPYQPHSFPISIKGVLIHDGHTVLLKNERDEWELPGGKLELGESAEQCVVREIEEELSLAAEVRTLVDVWVYTIRPDRIVFIVCFGMTVASLDGMRCSLEHKEAEIFAIDQVPDLNMPEGYKGSIAAYAKLLDGSAR